jgi:hypothetical protein
MSKASEMMKALKYELSSSFDSEESEIDPNDTIETDNPVIIAEHSISISTLSVSQAVMIMDLENLPALVFKNSRTGRINVVYYKKSGNIAWIDSPEN